MMPSHGEGDVCLPSEPAAAPESTRSRVTRWHPLPTYHLKAPRGWLNDPCAPGYDPVTGTWHLFYQWNPNSCDWGDISWGHFTSRDGLRWTHNGTEPVLKPGVRDVNVINEATTTTATEEEEEDDDGIVDCSYDRKGIFTGCMHPTGINGEAAQLTVVYSSVRNSKPIHWTRQPYERDCAGLALAVSLDGGRSWRKRHDVNPVLNGEPAGLDVTGFRDPFLAEWPALDAIPSRHGVGGGDDERKGMMLYGVVAGGVVGEGPNAFLYRVPADDLSSWTYLGTLVEKDWAAPARGTASGRWGCDSGMNWECVNFMTLGSLGGGGRRTEELDFLLFGAEGGFKRGSTERCGTLQQAMWMAGEVRRAGDGGRVGVGFHRRFGGMLDNGTLYAPNSFRHPVSGARIVWGWIKEEELPLARRKGKGWTGYLSIPRELFLLRLTGVMRGLESSLTDVLSVGEVNGDIEPGNGARSGKKKKGLMTLGIRPLPSLELLRQHPPTVWSDIRPASDGSLLLQLKTARSANWELEAVAVVKSGCRRVGFHVRHSEDMSSFTSICFSPEDEEIVLDRSRSNIEADIAKESLAGPFTLFVYGGGCGDGGGYEELSEDEDGVTGQETTTEKLRLRIFSDGDVLEIFANDRFALSAAVYADAESCLGISASAECVGAGGVWDFGDAPVWFERVALWENLGSVYE